MPLPPAESEQEEKKEDSQEPKLQFSFVECLLFAFHHLARNVSYMLIRFTSYYHVTRNFQPCYCRMFTYKPNETVEFLTTTIPFNLLVS